MTTPTVYLALLMETEDTICEVLGLCSSLAMARKCVRAFEARDNWSPLYTYQILAGPLDAMDGAAAYELVAAGPLTSIRQAAAP